MLLGEKEKDKLKEVLGWVDGFVKVTILCVRENYNTLPADYMKDDKFAAGGDSLTLADICLLATYTTLKVSY